MNNMIENWWIWTWNPNPCGGQASKHKDEDTTTLKVGYGGKTWDFFFREVFDVLGCRFHHDGKGLKAPNGRYAKVWAVGGGTSSSFGRKGYPW